MEQTKTETAREKAREFLRSKGKDPDKLMPKSAINPPDSQVPGADSSPDKKEAEGKTTEKEHKDAKSRAAEAKAAEDAKKAEEDKKLLEAKDEELDDAGKKAKKELLVLKETEREAKKEASIQKRIDELVGDLKAEKADREQDKKKINDLESELKTLRGQVDRNPEKDGQALAKLQSDRIKKYETDDKALPREQRREMSREDLEEWMVEDMVAAQEWIAERQMRRRDDRAEDEKQVKKPELDRATKEKGNAILKKQDESSARVIKRHPELDTTKRMAELRNQGKSEDELRAIIYKENPKVKMFMEIMKEEPDDMLSENGPELIAAEMEKRLKIKPAESDEDRIRDEAAESERQRQAEIEAGLQSTRGGGPKQEGNKDPLYLKQLEIWKKQFPNLSEAEVKARLDKRLKQRRESGYE